MTVITAPTLRAKFSTMLASTRTRLLIISRYPGQLFTDIFIPIVIAAMPILLGRATGGAEAAEIFAENSGTANYVGFMIIGASVFTIVSTSFWHIAYWLRWEMETGTIETLYLSPSGRIWIMAGVALYSGMRSITSAFIAYFVGSWIMGVNPLEGDLFIAFLFILVGMMPLYGMTLIFGAVVLKLKEANALVGLMQWVVSLFMGLFFPVAVFPPALKAIAMLFPPTWMTNGVRSALLGVGFFFEKWYLDMAVLGVFFIITPLLGYWIFAKVETGIRKNEGVGKF